MRIVEFASAEEQIALWKLISDSVWQALSAQQRQEAERKQAQKLRKPKAAGARKKALAMPPVPVPPKQQPQPPTPQKTLAQVQGRQQQSKTSAPLNQRQTNPQSAYMQQQPNVATTKNAAQNALTGQKTLDMRGKLT